MNPHPPEPLPTAKLTVRRRWSPLWLLPIAAAALSAWLLFSAFSQRGIPIEIEFGQGHGLKPGDVLRYRGITVGSISDVVLTDDLDGIRVIVRLDTKAAELARASSRFWIVRPQLNLSGVTGLETVIGANYLSVLPGAGEARARFVGLDTPPPPAIMEPGGLEIVLSTPGKGGLRDGAPVSYRQVVIGTIVSVDLAKDVGTVEALLYIKPTYTRLIRDNSRFWKNSGASFSAGLHGLSLNVDSVHSLILGGVNLAIPPEPGKPVEQGHIFKLYEEPEREWLAWTPGLSLYDGATSLNGDLPQPLPVTLSWTYKNLFYLEKDTSKQGWVLPVADGLLGPADLLTAPADALPGSVELQLANQPIALEISQPYSDALVFLPYQHDDTPWPTTHQRSPAAPEDTLVIAGPGMPERYIAKERYRAEGTDWRIDQALSFEADWHGAAVIAQTDGALIGILLVTDNEARTATLPPTTNE